MPLCDRSFVVSLKIPLSKNFLYRLAIILVVAALGFAGMVYLEHLDGTKVQTTKTSPAGDVKVAARAASEGTPSSSVSNERGAASEVPRETQPARPGSEMPSNPGSGAPDTPDAIEIPSAESRDVASHQPGYDPRNDRAPNELIVLDPPADFAAAIAALGYTIVETRRLEALSMTFVRLRIPNGLTLDDAQRQIETRFPGISIDANHYFIPAQDQSAVPRFRRQDAAPSPGNERGLASATADKIIESRARRMIGWKDVPPRCGDGVRIGMIDGAVDTTHPALADQSIAVRDFYDPAFKPGAQDHGTAMAALFVGRPGRDGLGGLLPGAGLRVATIFSITPDGRTVGSASALLRGIDWLVQEKVHVVNIGLTGPDDKNVRKAMTIAQKNDLMVVAAVGNRGWGPDRPAYPAAYYNVIAVTAVGAYRGIMADANTGPYVAFAAPGEQILTAVPGGGKAYQAGTSFAAAFITALVGMEIFNGAAHDPDTLSEILRRQIEDLGAPGRDDVYGWGFVTRQPGC